MTTAFACKQTVTQNKQAIQQDSLKGNISVFDTADPNNSFLIDTVAILTNRNLDSLITRLEDSKLKTYKTVKEIPSFIINILSGLTSDGFSIANQSENWQATDAIMDDSLPNRQLSYFGLGDDIALLTYYTGGIGKSLHIIIIKFQDKKILDFWCGNVLINLKDKKEIVKYLKENKNKNRVLNTNIIYL